MNRSKERRLTISEETREELYEELRNAEKNLDCHGRQQSEEKVIHNIEKNPKVILSYMNKAKNKNFKI